MKSAHFALMFGTILYAGNVLASNCVQMPDCQSLGFTKTESECSGKPTVFCPTDKSKAFCSTNSNEKIETPLPILFGDGTVSNKLLTGKTPIGIVFDETNHLAVALTDVKKDGSAGSETMFWSNSICNVSNITDCGMPNTDFNSCGEDGKINTAGMLMCGCCHGTPAATACYRFEPIGCSKDFCKKGKWFLPSMKELQNIYLLRQQINTSLTLLKDFESQTIDNNYYWSSTERNQATAWLLLMGTGYKTDFDKNGHNEYVRPVVSF